jgi:hypothetical protein
VIPVDPAPAAEMGEEDGEVEDPARRAVAVEPAVVEPSAIESTAEAAAPAAPAEVDERPPAPARSRRARQRATPVGEAASSEVAPAVGDVTTVAPAPAAVDSALSERVETLEHGLRRVLAEVKNLRELLADPSADR